MSIGLLLGVCVGGGDGGNVGKWEGSYVGSSVGLSVGEILGVEVGDMTGLFLGVPSTIDEIDGRSVGLVLGALVVGDSLGLLDDGAFVVTSIIFSSILILGDGVGTPPS